jgi:predicted dehydrogenase
MKKELQLIVSRSYGPGRYDDAFETQGLKYPPGFVRWTETENLHECVRLMDPLLSRRLEIAPLISHRFPLVQAKEAYDLVVGNTAPHLGVVLAYDPPPARRVKPVFPTSLPAAAGACVLGVIGAGNFARAVLLPELARRKDVTLRTIVTQRGLSAEHARGQFGFANCATDIGAVLDDPAINAVLIATRHASHAALAATALEKGKSVLVEKPLALTREELARVAAAREGAPGFLLVGFNRRFAPMVRRATAHLARHAGAKFLTLRVNAGALPAESWVNEAAEGGGRILGELCHFVDLARALIGAELRSVQADAGAAPRGVCEDLAVSLAFADGSLATIAYTALGDPAFSKERFEIFAGGTVLTIDNFLSLTVTADGRSRSESARMGQDKGHAAELAAFVAGVRDGTPPVPEAELFETSLATIAVLDSLREGKRVELTR